ncbi:DUF445 domain-containing protein [Thermoanaerobacterium sp. DL9XJH110]|uniref:DUF445 domain-containing protein n=1 Tax=Thermoanaerobacterium sp. DL9XJH110 TaxID=3386643 RepID=UPI003BB56031
MNYFQFLTMPLVGALIGWWTNLLAIKLLFRPIKPVKIPLLGIQVQGLIPKRRLDISRNIGEALEEEILSPDDIVNRLISDKNKDQFLAYIRDVVIKKVYEKLPSFIPHGFKSSIAEYLGDIIDRHGGDVFDELKNSLLQKAKNEVRLKEIVEEKINSFNLEQLENLIIKLSRKELKQIEILGGVIGFFVGVIQAIVSFYMNLLM